MADEEEKVKGGKEAAEMAAKGLALFANQAEDEVELDVEAATKFKEEADAKKKAIDEEAAALTGAANKKERTAKSKEASEITKTPEYIDALKVIKGQTPKNGHFCKIKAAAKSAAAPVAEAAKDEDEKDDKKKDKKEKDPKKQDNAGISKAERDELEKLKNDIIARKTELKSSGMSGGQINKDAEIVGWVNRMNELKEKENPGCLTAQKDEKKGKKKALSADQEAAKADLEKEIEEYRVKLKGEFGYSNKEIKADPDLNEMLKKLEQIEKA